MKRIILAGGSGFLGRALASHLQKSGYSITILTRSPKLNAAGAATEIFWDGRTVGDWARELEGACAVINLAGRSVNCRYTPQNQRLILDSRVESTRALGQAIALCQTPPSVWLNASTATIYRHTYGPAWDESGEIGASPEAKDQFSVQVATAWERALDESPTPRTRKVALRAAMVLGRDANSVFPMLRRLARCGLGGRMGHGRQFVSWIHQQDFCRAVEWLLKQEDFSGAVNLAAPRPVTNQDTMRTFRQITGVPFGLPAAAWMLEFGAFLLRTETELIIKSRHVIPRRLLASGFTFYFSHLTAALTDLNQQEGASNECHAHHPQTSSTVL